MTTLQQHISIKRSVAIPSHFPVYGVGIDITETDRFSAVTQRFGVKFANKILSANELTFYHQAKVSKYLQQQFAFKEAFIKALGYTSSYSEIAIWPDTIELQGSVAEEYHSQKIDAVWAHLEETEQWSCYQVALFKAN